jgi:general secretion pathway protein D
VFNDSKGILLVRATLRDLDVIEQVIQVMNILPPVVHIRSRYCEISQDDGAAFGFDWYLGNTTIGDKVGLMGGTAPSFSGTPTTANPQGFFPGTTLDNIVKPSASDQLLTAGLRNTAPAVATLTGILTEPQFRAVVRALEQRQGIEVISAPEVTTVSGRHAQLRVQDIQRIVTGSELTSTILPGLPSYNPIGVYPTTTEPVQTTDPNTAGRVLGASQYTSDMAAFGPSLDVLPYVSSDGYTIQMVCIPTINDFVGYDDPGKFVPQIQTGNFNGSNSQAFVSQMPLPHYRVRQVTTMAIVWDGQTMVLGGLISENVTKTRDKVPVLGDLPLFGRFFRSESNVAQKKNLTIFVTPTILDPAGNRAHTEATLPFAQTRLPDQRPIFIGGAAGGP